MLPTVDATASADEWRNEAIRRWGTAAGSQRSDWKTYVESRLSTPPPVKVFQIYLLYSLSVSVKKKLGITTRLSARILCC